MDRTAAVTTLSILLALTDEDHIKYEDWEPLLATIAVANSAKQCEVLSMAAAAALSTFGLSKPSLRWHALTEHTRDRLVKDARKMNLAMPESIEYNEKAAEKAGEYLWDIFQGTKVQAFLQLRRLPFTTACNH